MLPNGQRWLQFAFENGSPSSVGGSRYVGVVDKYNEWIPKISDEGRLHPIAAGPSRLEGITSYQKLHECRIKLDILRACRQIYNEANPILWTMNTFSFNTAHTCQLFFELQTSGQKAALRSLHLFIDLKGGCDKQGWNVTLSKSLMRSLKGLSDLRLVVEVDMQIQRYRAQKSCDMVFCEPKYSAVLNLSRLPLQNLHVVMRPYQQFYLYQENWTQSEKDEYGERLKHKLLNSWSTKRTFR